METLLIVLIVALSVAVCALGTFWFIREARSDQRAKPLYVPRGNTVRYAWDESDKGRRNLR